MMCNNNNNVHKDMPLTST